MKLLNIFAVAGMTAAVVALLLAAGCSSEPAGTQASVTPSQGFDFTGYVLAPSELPAGLIPIAKAPMKANDTGTIMNEYGWQDGFRVLYQTPMATPTAAGVIEQDIVRFPPGNASAIIGAYKSLFQNSTKSGKVLLLPDPGIGDQSLAVKITTSGANYFYEIAFEKSDLYEQFTLTGTPDDYQNLLKIAEQAGTKIR
jgi:hypothetical protein